MMLISFEECYAQLGLAFGADAAQVKQAWKARTLKCHPDKFAGNPKAHAEATALQMELNNARDQLLKFFKDYPGATPPRQPSATYQAKPSSPHQESRTTRESRNYRFDEARTGNYQGRTNTGRTYANGGFRSPHHQRPGERWTKEKPQSDIWQRVRQDRQRQEAVKAAQRRAVHQAEIARKNQLFVAAAICFATGGLLLGIIVCYMLDWF